jgi:transketolase C-terminal domain/subunit
MLVVGAACPQDIAKRGEIESGLGQCVAEMVAAQSYNQLKNRNIPTIYGCATSGTLWQFLKLEGSDVTIDPKNLKWG